MKSIIFLLFAFLTSRADAQTKMEGEAKKCERDVRLEAVVGDNNVYAYLQGERHTLFPRGNYVFMKDSPFQLIFDTYNRRNSRSDSPQLIYTHPSTANKKGKIEIREKKKKTICEVEVLL
jgi:hypothetical protein